MPTLQKPHRLEPGHTVAVVAPAGSLVEDRDIDLALARTASLGFNVRPGAHLYERLGYLAGSDDMRAADLMAAFSNPEIDGILTLRGGYGSARLLDRLDYGVIAANPKPIVGYSDLTALLNAIHLHTGLITFHGPTLGVNLTPYTLECFQQVLMAGGGDHELAEPPPFEETPGVVDRENALVCLQPGQAEGRLIGGNLSILCSLLGTPHEPDLSGCILFLEDINEPTYRVDRMLNQLRLSGKLDRIAGLVLGKFTNCRANKHGSLTLEYILTEIADRLDKPTAWGLMIGHEPDQATLPIGARVALDADSCCLTLLESAVRAPSADTPQRGIIIEDDPKPETDDGIDH